MAEDATTAGEARYANAFGEPILPLKFLFVAEIPTSPSSSNPVPNPMQGPHPAGRGIAPASNKCLPSPAFSLSSVLHLMQQQHKIQLHQQLFSSNHCCGFFNIIQSAVNTRN